MKNTDFDVKRIAEGYKNRPFLHRQVIEQFQRDIQIQHFESGLDIGCGAGLSTKALHAICTNVLGIDISPEMIRVADEVCAQEKSIRYLVSSAEHLSTQGQKFDIATAAGAIQWIDRAPFLSNMGQILKTNGYLLIYDFSISDTMLGNSAYTDWWHNQYLRAFPKPYRNEDIWQNEDVAPYGFHIQKQRNLKMEYSFSLKSFVDFMMIQSNVNTQIQQKKKRETDIYQWFLQTLSPLFDNRTQHLLFQGYSWYLQKQAVI